MTLRLPLLILLTAIVAACDSETPTAPSDPPVEVSETFPGTLTPNGGDTYSFAVSRAGDIIATLTSLGPDSDAKVGLNIGSWNGQACFQTITKDDAGQGTTLVGQASATGNYCVRIYDAAGTVPSALDYSITVRHF